MDVYLDHHATTPCRAEVVDAMIPWFTEHFGNAASRSHRWGYAARQAVEDARGAMAFHLRCSPKSLVFTSGATEANNLALLGVMRAAGRGRVVTVATEHKAVLDPVRVLERQGFAVTIVPVEADGRVDPDRFAEALAPDTVLASVMAVNNEIGTLQSLEVLGGLCRERGILFHTDAAQALSWRSLDLGALPVDLASFSAHKAYGPKGVGALYVRRGRPRVAIEALQHGGGHERGLRSGTLPVPLIVGFGAAVQALDLTALDRIAARRDRLLARLETVGGVTVNGSRTHRAAGNLNVQIEDVDVKALLLAVPDVAFSTGSACTSASLEPSHVLRGLGLDGEQAARSVRFGIGHTTTDEEVDLAADRLCAGIERVRELQRSHGA
jgi:cysteine desulfurase